MISHIQRIRHHQFKCYVPTVKKTGDSEGYKFEFIWLNESDFWKQYAI